MDPLMQHDSRRLFLQRTCGGALAVTGTLWTSPGAFAEALTATPKSTEGPFYPDHLPIDTDNDLLIINDKITPAMGQITHLYGRVTDAAGNPQRNVVVEIWQVDGRGVYLHSGSSGRAERDANFQGFGRFLTNIKGEYYFRTVKPVPYPGRTPHIHFAVNRGDRRLLTTQMYIQGEAQNQRDGLLQRIRDPKQQSSVLVDFKPLKGSKIGEMTANFDIVLGHTPADG